MSEKDIRILEHSDFAALSAELIDNSSGFRFRAHGRSMLPTICSGDALTVEKVDPDQLRIGDIVLVQDGASLLSHRIIKKNHGKWTTCGDALSMHDEPFAADQLIGRVTSIEHNNTDRAVSRIWGLWRSRLRRLYRFAARR